VNVGIHLYQNGREAAKVDIRIVDLNVPYQTFIDSLLAGLTTSPFRLQREYVDANEATIDWLWLTSAKDQGKKLPTLNALVREEHYESIGRQIRESMVRNKKLSNQILRIHVSFTDGANHEDVNRGGGGSTGRAVSPH
jgi:hypothetical protein